ncbi:iron complex transport system ATP-binding protein [Labedella gwakjiensis]|uniref:Iron complex transport system ATP-binding protein n=1 Tax=Labedella gwakjiensis TaxID=390269 RepID=A0A2P8GRG0_9MICO|nr:heme ABC transporter ATP-binding protein [Labedella gwakjiensis]PSL36534.1 iron complex transport system ATP-binding protein [Labedella gwakjiensis]
MTAIIEARGLHVRFGAREILTAIDLAVGPGELVALVGPNGAGKSTLLHALSGDAAPTDGAVHLDGRPLGAYRPVDLARRRSVLTQSNEVSFPFSAREVVEMGRAPWRGRPEENEDDAHIERAVEDAEIAPLLDRTITELSGGERARVAFARVRAQACPLILLDEPTASLDIRHQERVLARLHRHADEGGAVVVVLHDLDLAAAYAGRVVVLEAGRIRADGPPREALSSDLLSEVYRHPIAVSSEGDTVRVGPVRSGSTPPVPPTDHDRKEHPAHA